MIFLTLFWEFAKVGLFCVGGGYASMPLIQASVVDTYRWLTMTEFIDIFTISQMTPGPIGINAATFAGMQVAGPLGAVSATLGFAAPSLILCIFVARLFFRYGHIGVIRGVLNGLRPAVVALIGAAGVRFVLLALIGAETPPAALSEAAARFEPQSACIFAFALFAVYKKTSVVRLLLVCGALGVVLGLLRWPVS